MKETTPITIIDACVKLWLNQSRVQVLRIVLENNDFGYLESKAEEFGYDFGKLWCGLDSESQRRLVNFACHTYGLDKPL